MTPAARLILLVALALGLAACGYQLRGTGGAAQAGALSPLLERLYIEGMSPVSGPWPVFADELRGSGASLVADPAQASARLVVEDYATERRVNVVDPQARIREYELTRRLRFHVERPGDGTRLLPSQTVEVSRPAAYSSSGLLGSSLEEGRVLQELEQDIARQVLYRLMAVPAPEAR
ncbi:MAG: LPS assembly lipoprotein LptE [Halothiobacillaceae bacterium]|jgi:LPS-assembly lipoprotein|nr:LPS assembly lipoprotein LptE [Halothiobacillaceae bacterium]MDY0050552.1 LPS assembly lipoprotein LptE [Halothiobacillaceae bacterium]